MFVNPKVTPRRTAAKPAVPKSEPVVVLDVRTLRCTSDNHNAQYFGMVIATSNGYQALAYFGAIGKRLTEHPETTPDVSYQSAVNALDRKIRAKLDGTGARAYDEVAPELPDVPRLANGVDWLKGAKRDEFLKSHVTKVTIDPSAATRAKRQAEQHAALCEQAITVIQDLLTHAPSSYVIEEIQTNCRASGNPTGTVTLHKNGGTITIEGTSDAGALAICRRAALEIGGSFSLTGRVHEGRFLVTRDPGNHLRHARAHIVALDAPSADGPATFFAQLVGNDDWEVLIVKHKVSRAQLMIPRGIFREIEHQFDFSPPASAVAASLE